ncbi:MAG: MarR family winged helix-turn-helix transcriptional regulator [Bacteriovorax sp.]
MSNQKKNAYLADIMMDVIPKAMQSIREEMRKGRGDQLTVTQFRVLAAVNRGLAHNKEICDILGVSEAAISRMTDILVKEGLLKKGVNKMDKRLTVLSLSAAGAKLYNMIRTDAKKRLKIKLEALTEEDCEAVIKGLEILQVNLSLLK